MITSNGWCIWLTGIPGSGKSTISRACAEILRTRSIPVQILDSDEERRILTPSARYTQEERDFFYRALAWGACRLTNAGNNVIVAATAHKAQYRDLARTLIPRFAEVLVTTPIEVCARRDTKGLYGNTNLKLPGRDTPYEAPLHPDLRLDSVAESVESLAAQLAELCMKL